MKAKIKATGEIISVSPTYNLIDHKDTATYYTDGGLGLWAAEEIDFLSKKEAVVLDGYVARDGLGNLHFSRSLPRKRVGLRWFTPCCISYKLPTDLFPSVTWESGPKRVRLIIEEIGE